MNDLEFPFAEMSFKRTTPPTVVLNDTTKQHQPTSTVDPPKPNLTQRFVRRDEIYKSCNVHIQLKELTAAFLMALDKKLM
jgi:hypothetical protein